MPAGRALNLALTLVSALAAGCSSGIQSPVSPAAPVNAPPAPAAPVFPTAYASIAIEDAFAIGFQGQNTYIYEVRFLVRETGGTSGAVIKSVTVENPFLRAGEHTSKQFQSESCWQTEIRVPPGGTLDTFYTDAGSEWLGYCWVGIDALPKVESLVVDVFFKDDYGYTGSARATVSAFRLH